LSSRKRDVVVLGKIVEYCNGIENSIKRFGSGVKALDADSDYMDSVSMKILQIGELTTHLSEELKKSHREMPWQDIKGMRNIAAHGYHKFDNERLWGTMTEDIPSLRSYCLEIITQYQTPHQNCTETHKTDQDTDPEHRHKMKL